MNLGSRTIVTLLIFLLLCAGVVWLQLWLSRRPQRLPGLILPILSFAVSLIVAFGLTVFHLAPQASNMAATVSGRPSWAEMALTVVLYNVPTVVLLLLYAACRWRRRGVRSQMDKMRINDLE